MFLGSDIRLLISPPHRLYLSTTWSGSKSDSALTRIPRVLTDTWYQTTLSERVVEFECVGARKSLHNTWFTLPTTSHLFVPRSFFVARSSLSSRVFVDRSLLLPWPPLTLSMPMRKLALDSRPIRNWCYYRTEVLADNLTEMKRGGLISLTHYYALLHGDSLVYVERLLIHAIRPPCTMLQTATEQPEP